MSQHAEPICADIGAPETRPEPNRQGARRPRYVQYLAWSACVATFALGVITLAHTKVGRPWLSWLGPALGCPVNLDGGDPQRVEEFRRQALTTKLGGTHAKSHAALAFELGVTTRAEVTAWASARSRSCNSEREGSVLQCEGLTTDAAEPTVDAAHFQFDAGARLVAVDLQRASGCATDARAYLDAATQALAARVGPATAQSAPAAAADLQTQPFSRVAARFNYKSYVAELSATNLGRRGLLIRETFQWVPERV